MTPVVAADDLPRLVAGFSHCLRSGGIAVPISSSKLYHEALCAVGLSRRDDVYWAGRATLLTSTSEVAMYDAMFRAFFDDDGSGFKVRFEDEEESLSLIHI